MINIILQKVGTHQLMTFSINEKSQTYYYLKLNMLC